MQNNSDTPKASSNAPEQHRLRKLFSIMMIDSLSMSILRVHDRHKITANQGFHNSTRILSSQRNYAKYHRANETIYTTEKF